MKNRIREIRNEKKISGTKIAKILGISAQYFYDIEKGERNLSAQLASKIADILGVSVDYLLKKTDRVQDEDDLLLESIHKRELDLRGEFLTILQLLVDDEGFFFEDIRKDIFDLIDSDLYFYFRKEDYSIYGYEYRHFEELFYCPEELSTENIKEAVEEFNRVFNYRTFKQMLDYLDEKEAEKLLSSFNKVAEKNQLKKTPHEKEFVKNLELSNDKLLEQFNLELDGKKLTEDEAKGVIAYLRSLRSIDNEK